MRTTTDSALITSTATAIAAGVRSGALTAVEVAEAHLRRIAELNDRLGAFESVDPRRVLAEAAEVDQRADRGTLVLAGVPVAVKDCMTARGYPARHGSSGTAAHPAEDDDELVRRLRAAGAVVIGITRMPELAVWPFTQSRLGFTRHPDSPSLDPGGSTGGGAVAVATGMAAAAVGTDGGGSIRIPAAYCGLVGVKPGNGVVPLPGGLAEEWFGLMAAGPLTRTAEDARLVFDVIAGCSSVAEEERPARIALSTRVPAPLVRLWPDGRAAVERAATLVRDRGHTVVAGEPPYPRDLIGRYTQLWHAGVAQDAQRLGLPDSALEPRTAHVVRSGRAIIGRGGPDRRLADGWRSTAIDWFAEVGVDALLLPATAGPPVKAGALVNAGYTRSLLAAATRTPMALAWNLSGLPAAVVPVSIAKRRTGVGPQQKVGVQLVGRPGSEHLLLRLAGDLEDA